MKCKRCQKEFEKSCQNRKYCSTECRLNEKKVQMVSISRVHADKRKMIKKIKRGLKPKLSINEVNKLAKESGLSYGEYVLKEGL